MSVTPKIGCRDSTISPARVDDEPRRRAKLISLEPLAQRHNRSGGIGCLARSGLDDDVLDRHGVDVEIVEFEARRARGIPGLQQAVAAVEANAGGKIDRHAAFLGRGLAGHFRLAGIDARVDMRPAAADLGHGADRHRSTRRVLPIGRARRDVGRGRARADQLRRRPDLLADIDFLRVDDLASVRLGDDSPARRGRSRVPFWVTMLYQRMLSDGSAAGARCQGAPAAASATSNPHRNDFKIRLVPASLVSREYNAG